MGKIRDLSKPVTEVTFHCRPCRWTFDAAPVQVVDDADCDWHPYRYFASCPVCHESTPQAGWHRALMRAWVSSTGPKTPEGKAATAANLAGHPTPEEALRTRFNAMKTGLHAKTATYFPSKPDGYGFCKTCDVDRDYCASQPCCVRQTQLFMTVHAAFEQRDPKQLTEIFAGLQAGTVAVVQQLLQTIIADGVKVSEPQWYTDKEGVLHIAKYTDDAGQQRILQEISAHPLLKPLGEFLSRNTLSLADMGMTAKVVEENEEQMGRIKSEGAAQQTLSEFSQRMASGVEALKDALQRAADNKRRDPVLIEHQRENGGES